jgi:hypothetical protein
LATDVKMLSMRVSFILVPVLLPVVSADTTGENEFQPQNKSDQDPQERSRKISDPLISLSHQWQAGAKA